MMMVVMMMEMMMAVIVIETNENVITTENEGRPMYYPAVCVVP